MKRISSIIFFLSGEFLLTNYPNGGTVVLIRSILSSSILFLLFIISKGFLTTGFSLGINWTLLVEITNQNFKYGCAIFAGCYAIYYTRFASQWAYLAGTYNQLMAALVESPESTENINSYNLWKAGIVEDAFNLHLAGKPMFAPLVLSLLEDRKVLECFKKSAVKGNSALTTLESQLGRTMNQEIKFGIK